MNALEKNLAVARGEALGATLIAHAALYTALGIVANRDEALAGISAFIDDTLDMSAPAKGDPNDAFSTQMRETARFHAMQTLDAVTLALRTTRGRHG